jgi:hypothetical protein
VDEEVKKGDRLLYKPSREIVVVTFVGPPRVPGTHQWLMGEVERHPGSLAGGPDTDFVKPPDHN